MNRGILDRYKRNKRELILVNKRLDKLRERLSNVETISGKVTKSGDEYPYIEEHMTVLMSDPKAASPIQDRIRKNESRKEELEKEIKVVEDFINSLPEGIEKQILEMVYLEDFSQKDAAEMAGYDQSTVSRIIRDTIKDA